MRQRRPPGFRKETCAKCGNPLEESRKGKQSYCKACHAGYMRANRTRHSNLPEEARKKANARSYLNVYIRRGKVVKEGCCVCSEPAEAHIEDYAKPLQVKWYCNKHRLEVMV